jgi:predicted ArsR family transcriptional regulator
MSEKECLDERVLEYLLSVGYTGFGSMSRELGVTRSRVKRALRRLVVKGKVEVCRYATATIYRAIKEPEVRSPTGRRSPVEELVRDDAVDEDDQSGIRNG